LRVQRGRELMIPNNREQGTGNSGQ
jgi:hypothetical protein